MARALKTEREADELLRRAQEAAYRLPPDFGGFAATLRCSAGRAWMAASVRAEAPSAIEVVITEGSGDESLELWARRELASMVGHRWSQPYEDGDGRYAKRLEPDDDLVAGRLVVLEGDPFSSSYRIADGHVAEVNRRMGAQRFSIVVHARTTAADGLRLPAQFSVHHWDEESGRLVRSDSYTDAYVDVAGVLLPQRRRVVSAVDGGIERRELRLTGHVLLDVGRP